VVGLLTVKLCCRVAVSQDMQNHHECECGDCAL